MGKNRRQIYEKIYDVVGPTTFEKIKPILDEMNQDVIQHLIDRPKYINADWFRWESELEIKLLHWLGTFVAPSVGGN